MDNRQSQSCMYNRLINV